MGTPRIDRNDRNFIINGNFDFWQRVVGTTTTVNTASTVYLYTADRMSCYGTGATSKNFSILRSTDVPTPAQSGNASLYSYRFNCLTALTSPAAGDLVRPLTYRMEGQDYQRLHGKACTLSFWVKSSKTGTFPVAFNTVSGPNRNLISTFAISAANTWEFKTVAVTFESTGAYLFDNQLAMEITLAPAAQGTTWQGGSLNAWSTGTFYTTTAAAFANIMDLNTNNMLFAQVSLVEGSSMGATGFSRAGRTIQEELALCQRYYEKSYAIDVVPAAISNAGPDWGSVGSTGQLRIGNTYAVRKRASPSVILYSADTGAVNQIRVGASDVALTIGSESNDRNFGALVNSQTAGAQIKMHWTADAEL
jgi:hypothetical protein